MNRRRVGRIVPAAIALVLVILLARGVALSAASSNPFDQVLAKLDAIIGMLTPTPPAPAGPVKLASAPMLIDTATDVLCLLANLGPEPVVVYWELRELDGDLIGGGFEQTILPGQSEGANGFPGGGSITARCEATIDQPATTVRAHIELIGPGYVAIGDMR